MKVVTCNLFADTRRIAVDALRALVRLSLGCPTEQYSLPSADENHSAESARSVLAAGIASTPASGVSGPPAADIARNMSFQQ